MTSYWDDLTRQVSAASKEAREHADNDATFLLAVNKIEARAVRAVQAVMALPELPEDVRVKLQRAIDDARTSDALSYRTALRASMLLDDFHSIFHDIARRRIETTFGQLSDDPEGTLRRLHGNAKDAFTEHRYECKACRYDDGDLCAAGGEMKSQWDGLRRLAENNTSMELP